MVLLWSASLSNRGGLISLSPLVSLQMKYHGIDLCLCIHYVTVSNISSDLQELEAFTKRYGIHGLQLPLQLALVVSPCALFLDSCLRKQHLDRLALLRVSFPLNALNCVCKQDLARTRKCPHSFTSSDRAHIIECYFSIAIRILKDALQVVEPSFRCGPNGGCRIFCT